MAAVDITPGATVRIVRIAPSGRTKFVKTGTVGNTVTSDYFDFTEDVNSSHPGMRVCVTTDEAVTTHMKGWTQRTEILPH